MKTRCIILYFLFLFSISHSYAQSHISTGKYACKLVPKSLDSEKYLCPACEKEDENLKNQKIAEEKIKREKWEADAKAFKEKNQREYEAKLLSESTEGKSTEVVINAQGSSSNYSPNDPLSNYDPNTGLYSNPLATYNSSYTSEFQQNYETGVQIANTAVAIFDLFSPSPEEIAARERAEALRIQQEEDAARARAEKMRRISNRKNLIQQYPDGKTPLSSEAKNESEVYFFAYSHTPAAIEDASPEIYISEVFPLKKYGDGTWQFKTSLVDKLSKINNGVYLILSGYYSSKNEAEQKHRYFLSNAKNSGFSVKTLEVPEIKNSSSSSADVDFWGNESQSTQKTNPEPKKPTTDFWGNQSATNNIESENLEINKKSKDSITTPATKVKLDFWGNPIKK